MTKLIKIENITFASSPSSASKALERGKELCQSLESSNILFFPNKSIEISKEDIEFLTSLKDLNASKHIFFKPQTSELINKDKLSIQELERLKDILRKFSKAAVEFVGKLLIPYSKNWHIDLASFRPGNIEKIKTNTYEREDLLHTDAYPLRNKSGDRVLKFFININPEEDREWITGDLFCDLISKFQHDEEFSCFCKKEETLTGKLTKIMKTTANKIGLPFSLPSTYSEFMHKLHKFLKGNKEYQETSHKNLWKFPPNSSWLVFTDSLAHAVKSGQYALEQTFLIPRRAILNPEKSPLCILQRMTGENISEKEYQEINS
jgi:hypothetical protein